MRLLDFMRDEKLDDDSFAALLGDCSGHAVKKWKYGERIPSLEVAIRIEEVTAGKVTVRDWIRPSRSFDEASSCSPLGAL